MSNTTSCTAFLQSHVGRLPSRAGTAIRLLAGTKIGTWRVVGEGHAGTRSDTYPIVHERDGTYASMTVFDVPAVALASYTRRILETAQILTAIEHPGIESVVDAGLVADGRPYVVTEAHRGMSLAERIADEPALDPEDAIAILRGICEPLIAAHEMGVVHGSLALEHVFLVDWDDSAVKLLDWGIERAVLDEARRAGMELTARVHPVAPESALGIVSAKIDAYALGVIAYQLLLGRLPFDADSQVALRLLQDEMLPDPRALWPEIPDALESLLQELLAVDPRARPSIRWAADRLAGIAHELAAPTITFVPASDAAPLDAPATVTAPAVTSPAAVTAKVCALPPPDHVEWRAPFNWRIAAVVMTTVASAVLAIGVVQRAERVDRLATMAAPRHPPTLEVVAAAPAAAKLTEPPRIAPETHAPPVVAARAAAPAVTRPRPPVAIAKATPVTRTPPKRAARARVAPAAAAGNRSSELLTQYQRIGHDLMELRRTHATPATAEMWQQFRALKIEPALASANTRASAEATLRQLREKIERHKGVAVSDACRMNPLADGCK
jgi:serine/threonine-protein kinase